jgi:calcineurin-like phosphoesterase family protein
MNPWVIADTHLGHDRLIEDKCRPAGFSERTMTGLTRALTQPDDMLIHIGDVAFNDDEKWNHAITSLPGKKWLILGNHDRKSMTWYLSHGWDWVGVAMVLDIFGWKILFSHMPQLIEGSSMVNNHYQTFKYDLNVHGHFHDFSDEKIQTHEQHLFNLLTPRHFRIVLETMSYQPIKLKRIVELSNQRSK